MKGSHPPCSRSDSNTRPAPYPYRAFSISRLHLLATCSMRTFPLRLRAHTDRARGYRPRRLDVTLFFVSLAGWLPPSLRRKRQMRQLRFDAGRRRGASGQPFRQPFRFAH